RRNLHSHHRPRGFRSARRDRPLQSGFHLQHLSLHASSPARRGAALRSRRRVRGLYHGGRRPAELGLLSRPAPRPPLRGRDRPHLLAGLWNTAVLMILVSTLVLLVSLALSWLVVRSKARWRFLLDAVAFLPHAVPVIIVALSAAYVALFLLRDFVPIYGTVFLI